MVVTAICDVPLPLEHGSPACDGAASARVHGPRLVAFFESLA